MSDNEKFDVSADWSTNAQINQNKYNEWYETSFNNNEDFWNEHGKRIEWMKPYTKVKDVSFNKDNFSIKWYEDGSLNASANCIDCVAIASQVPVGPPNPTEVRCNRYNRCNRG